MDAARHGKSFGRFPFRLVHGRLARWNRGVYLRRAASRVDLRVVAHGIAIENSQLLRRTHRQDVRKEHALLLIEVDRRFALIRVGRVLPLGVPHGKLGRAREVDHDVADALRRRIDNQFLAEDRLAARSADRLILVDIERLPVGWRPVEFESAAERGEAGGLSRWGGAGGRRVGRHAAAEGFAEVADVRRLHTLGWWQGTSAAA
jgi:hypothetical protein